MIKSSMAIIEDRVRLEVKRGAVIDVYKLASSLRTDCFDMTNETIERLVSEWVIREHGNAVWSRPILN